MATAAASQAAPPAWSGATRGEGSRARRRQLVESAITLGITAVGLTGIGALLLIIAFVGKEALPLFFGAEATGEVTLGKLLLPQVVREGRPAVFMWQPVSELPKVSLVPLLLGTFKTSLVAVALAFPVGIGAALFVSELAPRRAREWLKPAVELLAGIPSVVLGFFALMVLASALQRLTGAAIRLNTLVAGVALAIAIVPVVFTVAEDALAAVPRSYRLAALALGATRWEVAWKVALPAASPGVVAALVLGFGRAFGETMIVLMASGNAALPTLSVLDSTRSMAATIAAEMGEVVVGSPHYRLLFLLGALLFVLALGLNGLAQLWVRRLARRLGTAA